MLNKLKKKTKNIEKNIHVLYLCYRHPKTPWYAKAIVLITLAYALSPIDLIPDFIPVLGYLDDLLILPLGIFLSIKLIPEDIFNKCKAEPIQALKYTKKLGLYSLVTIIIFWILIIFFCFSKLVN